MVVNTDFNFTKLQCNKLGTYTRKSKIQRNMLMASVFTYLSTTCFPLRAIDRSSNVQYRNCSYFPYNRNCPVISAPLLWIYNIFANILLHFTVYSHYRDLNNRLNRKYLEEIIIGECHLCFSLVFAFPFCDVGYA